MRIGFDSGVSNWNMADQTHESAYQLVDCQHCEWKWKRFADIEAARCYFQASLYAYLQDQKCRTARHCWSQSWSHQTVVEVLVSNPTSRAIWGQVQAGRAPGEGWPWSVWYTFFGWWQALHRRALQEAWSWGSYSSVVLLETNICQWLITGSQTLIQASIALHHWCRTEFWVRSGLKRHETLSWNATWGAHAQLQ